MATEKLKTVAFKIKKDATTIAVAIVGRAITIEREMKQRSKTKNLANKIKSNIFTRNNGKINN